MRTGFFTLLAFFAFLSTASLAQSSDAQRLKTLAEEFISRVKENANESCCRSVKTTGEVIAEELEGYTALTLPQIKMMSGEDEYFDIGIVSINAKRTENPQAWALSIAVPKTMNSYGANNLEKYKLDIENQNIAGIYDERINMFSKLNAALSGIKLHSAHIADSATINELKIIHDIEANEQELWSGESHIQSSAVKLLSSAGSASVGGANIKTQIKDWSPQSPEPNSLQKALLSAARAQIEFNLNDVSINTEQDQKLLSLQNAQVSLKTENLNTDKASFTLSSKLNGLSSEQDGSELSALLPEAISLNIALEDIPHTALPDVLNENSDPQNVVMYMQLQSILASTQATLAITDTEIKHPQYNITLNGELKADSAAVFGVSGNVTLRFQGLEHVLSKAQVMASDQTDPNASQYRGTAAFLEKLKTLGKVESNENGFIHVYALSVEKSGNVLLNDLPALLLLQPLFMPGLMMSPAPSAE